MKITTLKWTHEAWEDYEYWQQHDKAKLKKVNKLIKSIKREPFEGMGKPEKLKFRKNACSRRINIEHRLVYEIYNDTVLIHKCRFHYEK